MSVAPDFQSVTEKRYLRITPIGGGRYKIETLDSQGFVVEARGSILSALDKLFAGDNRLAAGVISSMLEHAK